MPDPYVIQTMVFGVLGFTALLLAIVFMLIKQNKRKYLHQAELREKEYRYKNELLNTQLELQEHLLSQVSQEIHDNVGQVLSLVKVQLFTVSSQVKNERAVQLLGTSSELLNKAIEDLRNISHAQSACIIDRLGLKETLSKELGYIRSLKNVDCELEVTGDHISLLPEQELFIYRIAQEAISNTIRHASATRLSVKLNYEPDVLMLEVTDNGCGFDVSKDTAGSGIGIAHMRHRAKMLQTELQVSSQPGHGTKINLKIPIYI